MSRRNQIYFEGLDLDFDRKPIRDALKGMGKEVAQSIRRNLRAKKKKTSNPGDAPARQTGNLARSIRYKLAKRGGISVSVGPARGRGSHGHLLEFGTGDRQSQRGGRGQAAPRPYLQPAVDDFGPDLPRVLGQRLGAAIVARHRP